MFAKVLEGFTNFFLEFAGLPAHFPAGPAPGEPERRSSHGNGKVVEMVPVKNFLHYL
jgi:hypothetical protein